MLQAHFAQDTTAGCKPNTKIVHWFCKTSRCPSLAEESSLTAEEITQVQSIELNILLEVCAWFKQCDYKSADALSYDKIPNGLFFACLHFRLLLSTLPLFDHE